MKKILSILLVCLVSAYASSQIVFTVNSPSGIAGSYDFSIADATGGWGSVDMLDPFNAVEDTLMFVEDGTPGTNPQGNPMSREGCNPLINDLSGKIAVIYRNTCEFGAKAFNAQVAGARAVIIINREDAVVGMGPGADGASVTIPVIMVSSVTGQYFADLMNNGQDVVAFIGNKFGLYDNDLGLKSNRILIPSPNTNHTLLSLATTENMHKVGAMIYNYGNFNQTNINLMAEVAFNGSYIYSQNVTGAASLASGDSVFIELPDFSASSYPVGTYTLSYTVTSDQTEEYATDNIFNVDFFVSQDLFTYSSLDANLLPEGPQNFRTSSATTSFQVCTHFQDPNASRVQLDGVYFSAAVNDPSTLVGQDFLIHVLEWSDVFTDFNSTEFTNLASYNLTEINTEVYNFASESENTPQYVPFGVVTTLTDNMRYLVCVETFDANTFLGFSGLDYEFVFDTLNQPISPIITDNGVSIFGFNGSPASSIGLKLSAVPTSPPIISANGLTEICSGSTITLTSSAASGNQWNLNGSPISGQTGQTMTVSSSGNYTVTANGQTSNTIAITVNTFPPVPVITANGPTSFCDGGSVILTSSSATNNRWSTNELSNSIEVFQSGSFTVSVNNGNCISTSTPVNVIANSLPLVDAGADQAICQGETITLVGSGAVTYSWDNGITDGVAFSPTSTTLYTVTGVDANSCSASDQVLVTVNTGPAINAGADQTVCAGDMVVLQASGAVGITWDNGVNDGVPFVINQTITFTASYDDGVNCTSTDQVTITVNSLPIVNAGNDASVCSGSPVSLTGSGAVSYNWDNGVTDGIAFTPSSTSTYTVTGTDNNGCINSDQVVVTVNSLPSVNAGNDIAVCENQSVVLSASGALSYSWDNGVFDGAVFFPTASNTYTVIGTDANGCQNTDQVMVSVNSNPSISQGSVTQPSACGISDASIQLLGGTNGNLTWTGTFTGGMTVASFPALVSSLGSGVYSFTLTDVNGCISNTVSTSISDPGITIPTISADGSGTFCEGGSVTLTASENSGITWSSGETSPTISVNSSGSYSVIYANGACTANSAAFLVTVNPIPVISLISSTNTSSCGGNDGMISIANSLIGSLFWDNGVNSGVENVISSPYSLTNLSAGNYTLMMTSQANCTSNSLAVTLSDPSALASTITANGPTEFCQGGSVELSAPTASSYLWSTGEQTQNINVSSSMDVTLTIVNLGCSSSSAVTTITVNPLPSVTAGADLSVCSGDPVTLSAIGAPTLTWDNGITDGQAFVPTSTATYTVTGTDANNCSASDAITVTVNSLPLVNAGDDLTVCSELPVVLNGSGALSYSWDNGVIDGVSFTPTSSMNYTVIGTDANNCSASDDVSITVNPLPVVDAGSDLSVCSGTQVTLSGSGAQSYSWNNGISDGVSFTAVSTATYVLTGTDLNGCMASDNVTITVNPLPIVDAGMDFWICYPNTTGLLNATGADSYTWDFNGIFNNVPFEANLINLPVGETLVTVVGTDANGCSNSDQLLLTWDYCESINEESSPHFKIYPNPSSGIVTISCENLNNYKVITIKDITGRSVTTINHAVDTIDLSGLANGKYYLILSGDKEFTYPIEIIK